MFFPILVLTAMAAFAAGVFWFKQQRKAQRRNELRQLAQTMGLPFYEKDLFGLSNQLKAFDLFKRERGFRWGRGGRVTNIMRSQVDGTDVWLFDYSYVVHAGNTHREVRQTVFFANDKNFQLPDFRLRPENWWQKLLSAMGAKKDINFPEHPDFSSRFWLTGEIEALIREKFSPELQRFLTERPPVHLEGSNYYLIAYKPGKALNADETQVLFEHCCQLVQLMKAEGKTQLLDLAELKKEDAVRLPS